MSNEPHKPFVRAECTDDLYPAEFVELQRKLLVARGNEAKNRVKIELLEEKFDRAKDEGKKIAIGKVIAELKARKAMLDEETRMASNSVYQHKPWKEWVDCFAEALNEVGVRQRCTNMAPASTRLCWQHCKNREWLPDHAGVYYWSVQKDAKSRDAFLAEELKAVARLMRGSPKKETVKAKVRREFIEHRIREVGCDPAKIADDLKFAEDNIKANQDWMQKNEANKSISEKEKKNDAKMAKSNLVQMNRLKAAMEKQKKDCEKQKKG